MIITLINSYTLQRNCSFYSATCMLTAAAAHLVAHIGADGTVYVYLYIWLAVSLALYSFATADAIAVFTHHNFDVCNICMSIFVSSAISTTRNNDNGNKNNNINGWHTEAFQCRTNEFTTIEACAFNTGSMALHNMRMWCAL